MLNDIGRLPLINPLCSLNHNLDVIKTADYIIDMGPEVRNRQRTGNRRTWRCSKDDVPEL